jgi:hypothetical protein
MESACILPAPPIAKRRYLLGEKDITEKTLASFNDVFSDIVNGLLFGGRPIVDPDALSDAAPYSMYKADGKVHEQERDVCKFLKTAGNTEQAIRIAFLGFEHQTQYDKDMPLRVIGYDGAAYRAELSAKERYPVITIVLYFGNTHWRSNRTLHEAVGVPDALMPYVSDYKVNLFEIAFMSDEEISRFRSDFRIIADFIAHKRADPDYVSTDKTEFVHTDEVLKLMSLLTDDDRYELTLSAEGGKPKNMCEMLDRVEARGVEKGMAKGRAEGMAEGRVEGMAKGEDMVIALLRKLTPGSEDYNKALNASAEERKELYKKYGIA